MKDRTDHTILEVVPRAGCVAAKTLVGTVQSKHVQLPHILLQPLRSGSAQQALRYHNYLNRVAEWALLHDQVIVVHFGDEVVPRKVGLNPATIETRMLRHER